MKAESIDIKRLYDGTSEITFKAKATAEELNKVVMLSANCTDIDVEFKKHREKRSNNANAYLWKTLDKMASVLGSTKVEIYQEAIRQVGLFEEWEMTSEAVKGFARAWMNKGDGWLVEVAPYDSENGLRRVRVYKGSSCYDTKEMSRLIDYVVEEAKGLGIETLTPRQLKELKAHVC